jgi:hypothetical protein
MHGAAQQALRIVAELNTGYRSPEEVRTLMTRLPGKPVDESVVVSHRSHRVRQETCFSARTTSSTSAAASKHRGITIGDGSLIGHGTTLTARPRRRSRTTRRHAPGTHRDRRKVWLGANVTVTVIPGVTMETARSCELARASRRTSRRTPSSPASPPNPSARADSTPALPTHGDAIAA